MTNIKSIPERIKTIKVDVRVWNSLKSRKRENETFNDVIKDLLMERTQSIGNDDIKAIKYNRKISFFTYFYGDELGFEFEYSDVKSNRDDFVLDVKIKKIFSGRKIFSPSEFFGVDNAHKHYSKLFMNIYFNALALTLKKEFKIKVLDESENIAYYRQLYYDFNLSEESFKDDIEEPMRLVEDEKISKIWQKRIDESPAKKLIDDLLGIMLK